jgi:hypothetical protein
MEICRFSQFNFSLNPFHRLIIPEIPILPSGPGITFVECQIRRVEEGAEWINGHRFPIMYQEVPYQEPQIIPQPAPDQPT